MSTRAQAADSAATGDSIGAAVAVTDELQGFDIIPNVGDLSNWAIAQFFPTDNAATGDFVQSAPSGSATIDTATTGDASSAKVAIAGTASDHATTADIASPVVGTFGATGIATDSAASGDTAATKVAVAAAAVESQIAFVASTTAIALNSPLTLTIPVEAVPGSWPSSPSLGTMAS